MGQATIASARLKAVPIPSFSARINISCAAGSIVCSWGVRFLAILFILIPSNWAHPRTRPERPAAVFNALGKLDHMPGLLVSRSVPEEGIPPGISIRWNPRLDWDLQWLQVSRGFQRRKDALFRNQGRVVGHLYNLESAARHYVRYSKKLKENSANLKYMVVSIQRRDMDLDLFHKKLLLNLDNNETERVIQLVERT
jgi:hypothetical protein